MKQDKKRSGRAAVFAVLTPAAVLLSLGIDLPFITPVSLLCTAGACALYALTAVLYPSALMLVAALLSPAVRLLAGGTMTQAFASLTYIPAGIILALAVLKKKGRTSAITGVSLGLAGYTLLMFALDIVVKKHTLYMSAVREYIADGFGFLKDMLLDVNSTVLTFYSMQGVSDAPSAEEFVDSYLSQLRMLLPGLYACAAIILAFVITGLFAALLRRTGGERLLPDRYWRFTMSPVSAAVMPIAFFAAMYAGSRTSAGLTAMNVVYALTPGFYALGIRTIASGIRRGNQYPSSVGVIAGILSFLVSVTFPFIVTVLIFLGVWSVLRQEINKLAKKFTSE